MNMGEEQKDLELFHEILLKVCEISGSLTFKATFFKDAHEMNSQ